MQASNTNNFMREHGSLFCSFVKHPGIERAVSTFVQDWIDLSQSEMDLNDRRLRQAILGADFFTEIKDLCPPFHLQVDEEDLAPRHKKSFSQMKKTIPSYSSNWFLEDQIDLSDCMVISVHETDIISRTLYEYPISREPYEPLLALNKEVFRLWLNMGRILLRDHPSITDPVYVKACREFRMFQARHFQFCINGVDYFNIFTNPENRILNIPLMTAGVGNFRKIMETISTKIFSHMLREYSLLGFHFDSGIAFIPSHLKERLREGSVSGNCWNTEYSLSGMKHVRFRAEPVLGWLASGPYSKDQNILEHSFPKSGANVFDTKKFHEKLSGQIIA